MFVLLLLTSGQVFAQPPEQPDIADMARTMLCRSIGLIESLIGYVLAPLDEQSRPQPCLIPRPECT